MDFYNQILKRKSFHLFKDTERINDEEIEDIRLFSERMVPLYPDIKTSVKIVPECETTCKRGARYCILFYSEKKGEYLRNIGYLGEQLDLYLASKNIGALPKESPLRKSGTGMCRNMRILSGLLRVPAIHSRGWLNARRIG